MELGAQVFLSVQCWPVKHCSAVRVLKSQVGWTQLKVMLAAASPAKAPMLKIEVFMLL